jgi:hypothetical protein
MLRCIGLFFYFYVRPGDNNAYVINSRAENLIYYGKIKKEPR